MKDALQGGALPEERPCEVCGQTVSPSRIRSARRSKTETYVCGPRCKRIAMGTRTAAEDYPTFFQAVGDAAGPASVREKRKTVARAAS